MEITNRLEAAQYVRILLGAMNVGVSVHESLQVAQLVFETLGDFSNWDFRDIHERSLMIVLAKVRVGSNDAN